jgi:hypothetical protein
MAPTQHSFASWFLLTTVAVYRGGGGMEPAAPIIVVDGGIGGLCQQRSLPTEAVVGLSQRCQSLSLMAALAVFVNNGRC